MSGRLWVLAMEAQALKDIVRKGDIAVVGDLPASQLAAIELGVDLLVLSNGTRPGDDVVAAARAARVNLIVSPLDSYVSARMIQLAVPVGRVMDPEPLTVEPDDVLEDVTPEILDVEYRAAVVVDSRAAAARARPTRSALVSPAPRKVMLVDHAEESQSAPGIEQAEIVEILDHHHIGHRDAPAGARHLRPRRLDRHARDERFAPRGSSLERSSATMLLAAVLSDTVVLTSPTTTDRDRRVASRLGEQLDVEPERSGWRCSRPPPTCPSSRRRRSSARREGVRARRRAHRGRRAGRGGRRRACSRGPPELRRRWRRRARTAATRSPR